MTLTATGLIGASLIGCLCNVPEAVVVYGGVSMLVGCHGLVIEVRGIAHFGFDMCPGNRFRQMNE